MTSQKNSINSFSIGNRQIGDGHPVFVIAEVGINHHGDEALCAEMIAQAAKSGADAVKLQTVNADESYVEGTVSHTEFTNKSLSDDALARLTALARKLDIVLFSTPGDFASLEQMCRHQMPGVKISSGLMTNLPLIGEIGKRGLPVIISTGLAYESEIAEAVQVAQQSGASGVAVLKCTALYPAPDNTLNLMAMVTMGERFGVPVGYSDHTLDDVACIAAVALGATVIEKHFTLDSKRAGADHRISMEPAPFAAMVDKIRRLEQMRGDETIMPVAEEIAARPERHRCLVARVDIPAGGVFSSDNVGLKRPLPGTAGLTPARYIEVLGKQALVDIKRDQPIQGSEVKGLQ